jgi:hypothetical protein
VALNKRTGEVIWKSPGLGNDRAGYSPPMVADIGGIRQVVALLGRGLEDRIHVGDRMNTVGAALPPGSGRMPGRVQRMPAEPVAAAVRPPPVLRLLL